MTYSPSSSFVMLSPSPPSPPPPPPPPLLGVSVVPPPPPLSTTTTSTEEHSLQPQSSSSLSSTVALAVDEKHQSEESSNNTIVSSSNNNQSNVIDSLGGSSSHHSTGSSNRYWKNSSSYSPSPQYIKAVCSTEETPLIGHLPKRTATTGARRISSATNSSPCAFKNSNYFESNNTHLISNNADSAFRTANNDYSNNRSSSTGNHDYNSSNNNSSSFSQHLVLYPTIPEIRNSYSSSSSLNDSGYEKDHLVVLMSSFDDNSGNDKRSNKKSDDYNNYDDNATTTSIDDDDDNRSTSTSTSMSSLASITTAYAENFRESLLLPFLDDEGHISNVISGISSLMIIGTIIGILFCYISTSSIAISTASTSLQHYISSIIGYNYFILWSVCFYPQVFLNYRRQSTKGLSNDFAVLNCIGWTYYTIYLIAMRCNPTIQHIYTLRHTHHHHHSNNSSGGSGGVHSTVQFNDIAFSLHATILGFICLYQILYYGNNSNASTKKRTMNAKTGNHTSSSSRQIKNVTSQRQQHKQQQQHQNRKKTRRKKLFVLKFQTWIMIIMFLIPTFGIPLMIWLRLLSDANTWWFNYFYILSYFKICCTITKYSKQVVHNYTNQSTAGWNIWYNFLECSGGTLSMIQIVYDSIVINHDISGITGNLAKFLLGFVTIFFDALFFLQHYVWYNDQDGQEQGQQQQSGTSNYYYSTILPSSKRKHLRASSRFEINIPPEINAIISTTDNSNNPKEQLILRRDSSLNDDDVDFDNDYDNIPRQLQT